MIARRLTSLVIGLLVLDLTRAGGDRARVDQARDVVAMTPAPSPIGDG